MMENNKEEIIQLLGKMYPLDVAKKLKIKPYIVYDLIDSLDQEQQQSIMQEFLKGNSLYSAMLKQIEQTTYTSADILDILEQMKDRFSTRQFLELAELYYTMNKEDKCESIFDDIFNKAVTAKRREISEKHLKMRREFLVKRIREAVKKQKKDYNSICKLYNVKTLFLKNIIGEEERDR